MTGYLFPNGRRDDPSCLDNHGTSTNCNTQSTRNNQENPNLDDIYSYYKDNLIPAIVSSLPLLFSKLYHDIRYIFYNVMTYLVHFLIPWTREDFQWQEVPDWLQSKQDNFTQFLLRNLDTNNDGYISTSELLRSDVLQQIPHPSFSSHPIIHQHHQSFFRWFQYTFPLFDWKIGIFIWKSCGGLLLLIAIATIIPGRLHVWSGRIFRWPILFLTYLMIASELIVYIMVRLFIRLAEAIFSTRKHRILRKSLMEAKSYNEWRTIAKELDSSMGRDIWQHTIDDDTSYTYNWTFINELIKDLRQARKNDDAMLALVVLRQCARKNVGGVMNEDLFSVTNTGEPKMIVKEFLDEVVVTLRWLTQKSRLRRNTETTNCGDTLDNLLDTTLTTISSEDLQVEDKKVDPDVQKTVIDSEEGNDNILHWMDTVIGPVTWAVNSIISHQRGNINNEINTNKSITHDISPKKSESPLSVSKAIHDPIVQGSAPVQSDVEVDASATQTSNPNLQEREQFKTFLKRARAAYGRTALCLSGGGMMGCYHFGTIKALFQENILPHIISGTSAGSVVASMVCTRTDEEIRRDLRPDILVDKLKCFSASWPDRFRNVVDKGCLFDKEEWLTLIKWFTCGDLTFEEAYKKTGRILCITLSASTKKAPPVLVNYITAPDVTIASAIVASAAVPGFIKPVVLMKKGHDGIVRAQGENKDEAYWDGSIDQDIPKNGLAEMFNCQFFLASQCNPHIVPFFHNSKGCVAQPSRWTRGMAQDSWRGGFLLAALEMYLKSDMKAKFIFLNELEAAVSFTGTMMTQQQYGGTTTIVPQVSFSDYFVLFSDPTSSYLNKCFQLGSIAAYQHCSMMKHHYRVAHALDECLALLEEEDGSLTKPRRRLSQLASSIHGMKHVANLEERQREKGYSINASVLLSYNHHNGDSGDDTDDSTTEHDDECESGGFDGVTVKYHNQSRIKESQSK